MKTKGNNEDTSAQFRVFRPEDNFPGKTNANTALNISRRKWLLENGLQVSLYDQLTRGSIYYPNESEENEEQVFNLYLTSLPVSVLTSDDKNDIYPESSMTELFLINSGGVMCADIYDLHLQMLQIQFNEQWVSLNYPEHQYSSVTEGLSATVLLPIKRNRFDIDVFELIHAKNEDDYIFRLQHIILTVVSTAIKELLPAGRGEINNIPPLIEALIQIMRDHIFGNLPPISEIAAMLSTSESSLQRHFRDIFQKSVYEYYLDLKMSKATELLSSNNTSVKEVAFRLGYEDVSSFIIVFKKYAGELPGSVKRKSTSTTTEVKNIFFLKP